MKVVNVHKLSIGANLIRSVLSKELYKSPYVALFELIRNSVCAFMPDGLWHPGKGYVEVYLVNSHPLTATRSLVVFDRGIGFTDAAIERFMKLSTDLDDVRVNGQHAGASQKGIGRIGAYAVGKNDEFHLLTRTTERGSVRYFHSRLDDWRNMEMPERVINEKDTRLGNLKGYKGTFSAIIIPNPVFSSEKQIAEGIQWLLPRKKEQMFQLKVVNKFLQPPPLSNEVSVISQKGIKIEAYLARRKNGEEEGIRIVDLETGLPVARTKDFGNKYIPDPLYHRELTGDIFVEGVLPHQDAARSTLLEEYLKREEWLNVMRFLSAQVSDKARALLGDQEKLGSSDVAQEVVKLTQYFEGAFGKGQAPNDVDFIWGESNDAKPEKEPRAPSGEHICEICEFSAVSALGLKIHMHKHDEEKSEQKNGRDDKPRKLRDFLVWKIDDTNYTVTTIRGNPLVLAQVENDIIYINRNYGIKPSSKYAQREHYLLKILEAVAIDKHRENLEAASIYAAELRLKMLK